MTAIFLVWNAKGAAIAADQSVSVVTKDDEGQEQTLWTETENKLYLLQNKKVALASSGSATINNIPVNGILSKWEEALTEDYKNLSDYATNFVYWLAKTDLHKQFGSEFDSDKRVGLVLKAIRSAIEEDKNSDEIQVIENTIQYWESQEQHCLLGPDIDRFANSADWTNHDAFLTQKFILNFEPNKIPLEKIRSTQHKIEEIFEEQFKICFEAEYESSIKWHKYLLERTLRYFQNYIDKGEPNHMSLMFVGYGTSEWIPQCVVLDIYDYDLPVPKISVRNVTNPDWVWYQSLAKEKEFSTFLTGIDENMENSIFRKLAEIEEERNDSDTTEKELISKILNSVLDESRGNRIAAMRSKIRLLPVNRLEFVARQMVQIESLASFLQENLPSVGGEIDSVTISL